MSLSSISKTKNTLGYMTALIIILLTVFRPEQIDVNLFEILFIMIFPFSITDLVWNKRLYDGLMEDKGASYNKLGFSYKSFQVFGMVLSLMLFLLMIVVSLEYIMTGSYRLL